MILVKVVLWPFKLAGLLLWSIAKTMIAIAVLGLVVSAAAYYLWGWLV